MVAETFGLCGACWRDTHFIAGLVCDLCGTPLPGEASTGGGDICDDCMAIDRPWVRGRAALMYRDNARRLILALKHGDRMDLVRPAARWMAGVAGPCMTDDTVIVPVPVHYFRLLKRRYNQSAALGLALGRDVSRPCLPGALVRIRQTQVQDGMSRDARFRNIDGAIRPAKRTGARIKGRSVLLIDDVMTSGATLAASTEALMDAGARQVCTLVLARVGKDA